MTDVMWRQASAEFATERNDGRSIYAIPIPNAALREASSVSDLGLWYAIGEAWAQVAAYYIPPFARPQPTVADIGCGCGKMARFFVTNHAVRFIGLDVFRPAINWCRDAFSGYRDRFEFVHLDLYSELYNQGGQPITEAMQLPVEAGSVHMVICGSLFTHLLEPEMHIYLREIARILAPGGRMMASTHNEPVPGKEWSGVVTRVDMTDDYFVRSCRREQMEFVQKVGTIYGQEVFIVERRTGAQAAS